MDRLLIGALLGSMAFVACSTPPDPIPSRTTTALALPPAHPLRADGFLPGVVPFRGGGGPQVAAIAQCKSPRLFYFGGPLLQSPVILAVFWNSNVNATVQASIGQFYADVTLSSYWPWLQEYDSVSLNSGSQAMPRQAILPGSFGGNFVLAPQHCPASSTATCALTDAEIQTELVRQIGLGVLPAPTLDCTGNVDTLYMVDFPTNVSLSGPSGAGTSCTEGGFCGYHNTGKYGTNGTPIVYGVLMDVFAGGCSDGCGANATALENATALHSHELVEAVTDPDIGLDTEADYAAPAAWGDNNNMCGEIADICDDGKAGDTITVSGRSWVVQEVWSNQQGKCTSTGPAPAVCTGTTVTNCRPCSCGDNGGACSGATPVCETADASASFGACEACTGSGACGGGGTCMQDKCVGGADGGAGSGADGATDSGEDGLDEARAEAGVDAAGDGGTEAASAGGTEGGSDGGSDGAMAAGDSGAAPPDAGAEAGSFREDASSDALEEMLADGTAGLDSGGVSDASGDSALESSVQVGALPGMDASAGGTAGDNRGCGCRVAAPSSSPPALLGFGALACVGALHSRRKRGARS